jgi:hypothetical protein
MQPPPAAVAVLLACDPYDELLACHAGLAAPLLLLLDLGVSPASCQIDGCEEDGWEKETAKKEVPKEENDLSKIWCEKDSRILTQEVCYYY